MIKEDSVQDSGAARYTHHRQACALWVRQHLPRSLLYRFLSPGSKISQVKDTYYIYYKSRKKSPFFLNLKYVHVWEREKMVNSVYKIHMFRSQLFTTLMVQQVVNQVQVSREKSLSSWIFTRSLLVFFLLHCQCNFFLCHGLLVSGSSDTFLLAQTSLRNI